MNNEDQTAIDKLNALEASYVSARREITSGALSELKEKRKYLLTEIAEVENQIANLGGKTTSGGGKKSSGRVRVNIQQIADAIRAGATNYPKVAERLGCSKINVMNKIKKEGAAAGIHSRGERKKFELYLQ